MSKIFAGGSIPYGISKWKEPSDVVLEMPPAGDSPAALADRNQEKGEMQLHPPQPGEATFNCVSPLAEKTQFQFEDGRWFQITAVAGHFYRARSIKSPPPSDSGSPYS